MNLDQELHELVAIWLPIILLTTVALVFSINARPMTRRAWIVTLATYGQVAVPWLILGLLIAAGADHEGGWADSSLRLTLSCALLVVPLAVGVCVSWFGRGRRIPAVLMTVASCLLGAGMLLGLMLIGC